jgi:hypothetical protein
MPRQCILTAAEHSALLAFRTEKSELIRLYTFSKQDLSAIKQCRGDAPRLGFAVLWLRANSGSMKRFGNSRKRSSFCALLDAFIRVGLGLQ